MVCVLQIKFKYQRKNQQFTHFTMILGILISYYRLKRKNQNQCICILVTKVLSVLLCPKSVSQGLGHSCLLFQLSCICFKCYPGAVRPESFQSKYLVSQALRLASHCLLLLDLKQFIFSNMVWNFLLKNTPESGPKVFLVVLQISYSTQHILKNLVVGQCIFCFFCSIPDVKVRTFSGERSL